MFLNHGRCAFPGKEIASLFRLRRNIETGVAEDEEMKEATLEEEDVWRVPPSITTRAGRAALHRNITNQ